MLLNFAKFFKKDPKLLLESAYVKVEGEIGCLRADLVKSIVLRRGLDRHANQGKSIALESQKEENTLQRQVSNEAEIQIQTLFILKQWTIPVVLLLDQGWSEEVSNEYSRITKSLINRSEQYRKLGHKRTLDDTIELKRQILGEDSAKKLEQLVIKRIESAKQTFSDTESYLPRPEELIVQKRSLEHRLEYFTTLASEWQTRTQMALQQNHNELAKQALERQERYDQGCLSIRTVLVVLEQVIAAISAAGQTTDNGASLDK